MKFTEKAKNYINSIEFADEREKQENFLILAANRFARKHGYGKATVIDVRKDSRSRVIHHSPFGWVKDSTGEFVPMSYVNKCYGKGVHYQAAKFECQIGIKDLWLKI